MPKPWTKDRLEKLSMQMEAIGLVRHGRKALPENCVARTAAFFILPETN